ncbi:glutamate-5-semialdehyde dehydrogenase [Verrucomicrobium sp. GAS474]|uniref:glutamate-5-semialdehyde dehydrogenase n=1 Tax=Verrucomicrobium sp. GAS474 TaxID=1882831 RepID=UPI00087A0194|nr:glutamate-5-semialdehyde dehydrogenase [Verrucomicrobium sp. GAS474]SDU16987.1 glutamate-5-semialdehyde dehydrogenase [Verrucomicrobium sp. GAS474]
MSAAAPSVSEVVNEVEKHVAELCVTVKAAARVLANTPKDQIDRALGFVAEELDQAREAIFAANRKDLEAGKAKGLSSAMLDRLAIKEKTLADMIDGVRQVISLPNPVGETLKEWTQPNGIAIRKVRTPLGVIGIIYESRPNVTIDAAVLCLKTGNGVVLRGGSEAFHSNHALATALRKGLERGGIPADAVRVIGTVDRHAIAALCRQDKTVDVLIPRGGHGLIEAVVKEARMPVIKHFHGVCYAYVHRDADLGMAEEIIVNAKVQRPSACNSIENLLVDRAVAATFIPRIVARLHKEKVEVRGDGETRQLGGSEVKEVTEADWTTEYLDLILSAAVVGDESEAIAHIERYGSHHSDVIITEDAKAAERFFQEIDSATVYWNASTRFTDGAQFGFGAEIGISTDKLHARGPMALEELTSYKYLITGNGQVRK